MFRGFLYCRLARSPSRGILGGCFGGRCHATSLKMKLHPQSLGIKPIIFFFKVVEVQPSRGFKGINSVKCFPELGLGRQIAETRQ